MAPDLLAFLTVSLLVIVTPGPDTALTIRNTMLGGRAEGICTVAGVVLGQSAWALASSLGVVALLVASRALFLAIQYAGGAYLILLGVQSLRASLWPHREAGAENGARPARQRLTPRNAWRQGLISNLGNPKMALFFASLLPQFIHPGEATLWAFLRLGLIFCCMTFAWLSAYVIVVAKAGEALLRPKLRRIVEGATGMVLIALGLRIVSEQR
jgi:threonine/homoserine/homoserine lactone efflux protein